MNRDEIVQFGKDLFANVKLEIIEEQHYDSFYSHAAVSSPSKRAEGTGGLMAPRKSMMNTLKVPMVPQVDSVADMETAAKEAIKIWANLSNYVDLIPTTLRYLCKMIVFALRSKCGEEFTEENMKSIISEIIIDKVIYTALLDPIEYNVVLDCVVSDAYHRVANNVGKILRSLMTGKFLQPTDPLGMYANKFIESAQYSLSFTD